MPKESKLRHASRRGQGAENMGEMSGNEVVEIHSQPPLYRRCESPESKQAALLPARPC
ncbi:hypothetical protein AZA_08826 [Nitrospirillum viridazoti Y2]|nr:hypothetical protein AZA_08826 [Nitrospirillum amazonense Y2]